MRITEAEVIRLSIPFSDGGKDEGLAPASELAALDLLWVEEPIFPPEDFETLARLRRETGLRIATGENACTEYELAEMLRAGAADFIHPSVTQIGGISEMLAARRRARAADLRVAQHSPDSGPGYLATLQLLAAAEGEKLFEYLYIEREAGIFVGLPAPVHGRVAIPTAPASASTPTPPSSSGSPSERMAVPLHPPGQRPHGQRPHGQRPHGQRPARRRPRGRHPPDRHPPDRHPLDRAARRP